MEAKGNGVSVNVDPTQQSNEWLIAASEEIAKAA